MHVLVVEDGFEYTETLEQFLGDGNVWERAGSGPEAVQRIALGAFDALFLDMRFDRTPEVELWGDLDAVLDGVNGDPAQARRFLEDHQGTYILAGLRERGHTLPVLMSYDFDGEPRRWARLSARYHPVDYLTDNASPAEIEGKLRTLIRQRG